MPGNWNIKQIDTCDSTNNYLKLLKAKEEVGDKTAIMTEFQTHGRGQQTNTWQSNPGENILVSCFVKLKLVADQYFMLNILTSLAILRTLKSFGVEAKIKWPNDIYYRDKKIAGILIENSLSNNIIEDTIIGAGMNINQKEFPEWIPNPVSLYEIKGSWQNREEFLHTYLNELNKGLNSLTSDAAEGFFQEYMQNLYRSNTWAVYRYKSTNFNGFIHGIMPDGRLILETESGQLKRFTFGEIHYIL